jgi:signal transduction histidine kinase
MRFERKIFISVFFSAAVIGSLLIWEAHRFSAEQAREEFLSQYNVLSRVLGDILSRLDSSTEALMLNAAQVVKDEDAQKGLLSTEKLKSMRTRLGVTHIFVVDKNGSYIRSTNDSDELEKIPNLYSFCGEYRDILSKGHPIEATPVIKPTPEPKPYKFLYVPNASNNRILEVGVRVDSIAKTLTEAIKADKNVLSMQLFSPDGKSFGQFSSNGVIFDGNTSALPDDLNSVQEDADNIYFLKKVAASHPRCCQCDVAGYSKNGEYYYVLKSTVSKQQLGALQARMNYLFALLALGNLGLSFGIARLLSSRLVRNIRTAVTRVREIKKTGNLNDRIGIQGPDEVAYLTQEFDNLLESLEQSQKRLVEAEKLETKVELAKIVAHNIRSPIVAIEMMVPQLVTIPDRTRRILSNAVKEIRQLSEKLRTKPDAVTMETSTVGQMDELVFLPILLEDVVSQKRMEFGSSKGIEIILHKQTDATATFANVNSSELRSILSNLINNAAESYGGSPGNIMLTLRKIEDAACITVEDHGCGIPREYLSDLGRKRLTFKANSGRGLGLVHAMRLIESCGGKIDFQSELNEGTKVTILLKRFESNVTPHLISASISPIA